MQVNSHKLYKVSMHFEIIYKEDFLEHNYHLDVIH